MENKLLLGVFCLLFCAVTAQSQNGGTLNFEVGGKKDKSNIMNIFNKLGKTVDDSESGDGSGDVEKEIYSGSGSGEPEEGATTTTTTLKPITVTKIKTESKSVKTESKSTVMIINEGSKKPSTKTKTTESNEIIPVKSTEDPINKVGKQVNDDPYEPNNKLDDVKETGVNFTVGIIVGVVVGAILAILVIVFLVYRLRKKDEGSYSLDEPSSQAFIRDEKHGGGQGKEYFA